MYAVSAPNGDEFAMKVVSAGGKPQIEKFERECEMHGIAAEHGLAPQLISSWVSNKKGHIVMAMLKGTDFKALSEHPELHRVRQFTHIYI